MIHFKQRWGITSNWQVVVIIIVFAITGSCAAYLSKPILNLVGITSESVTVVGYYLLYIILIFPIYQILLVGFGFLFGQFNFFWNFEKKMLRNMKLGFIADFLDNKFK